MNDFPKLNTIYRFDGDKWQEEPELRTRQIKHDEQRANIISQLKQDSEHWSDFRFNSFEL